LPQDLQQKNPTWQSNPAQYV